MPSVLIVDDSMLIRMQLKQFFSDTMKYEEVYMASDGNEAVSVYKEKKPDLVTLDLTMPNKDGLEALKEILEINLAAKVLMISAIKDSAQITDCLNIGAKGFIRKPLAFNKPEFVEELIEDVKEAFE